MKQLVLCKCAGKTAGVEAALHAVKAIFSEESTKAILLVDATNAFNSFNRQVTLRNVRHLCPPFATALINIYNETSKLLINNQDCNAILRTCYHCTHKEPSITKIAPNVVCLEIPTCVRLSFGVCVFNLPICIDICHVYICVIDGCDNTMFI